MNNGMMFEQIFSFEGSTQGSTPELVAIQLATDGVFVRVSNAFFPQQAVRLTPQGWARLAQKVSLFVGYANDISRRLENE